LKAITLEEDEEILCKHLNELISACKSIAEACKINGVIRRIVSALPKIPPDTRWLFHLDLIEGCIRISDDLAKLLEPEYKKDLSELNPKLAVNIRLVVNRKSELKSIASFLKYFDSAVKALEVSICN